MPKNKKKFPTIQDLTPKDFPLVQRIFWTHSPSSMKHINVIVVLVCMMALGTRLRVKYYFDMGRSMLAVNMLCIGPSGAGKSVIRWIVQKLMKPLILRDAEERRREQDYRDECKKRGKGKDMPNEPLTVIRYLQSITVPKLVKRADFMVRRYFASLLFFIFTDELATMCGSGRSNRDEYNGVARTAYQEGETYIRETLYQDGYNASVDVNWCSIMCGQDYALDKYIDKAGVMLGDAGRQMIFRLEDLTDEAPKLTPFSEEEEREIQSVVDRLMNETYTDDDQLCPIHEVDMAWLDKDVRLWCSDQAEQVSKNGSRAQDSFYKRASTSAFRMATMMYYLWNEEKEAQKHVRRFYYAYAQFILDGLMAQWGKKYEQLMPKSEEAEAERPSLYDQLPKRFTRDQLRELIVKLELSAPARVFIHKWLKKKYIFKVEGENEVYEKIF